MRHIAVVIVHTTKNRDRKKKSMRILLRSAAHISTALLKNMSHFIEGIYDCVKLGT